MVYFHLSHINSLIIEVESINKNCIFVLVLKLRSFYFDIKLIANLFANIFCSHVCAPMLFRSEMRQHFLFTRIPFRSCYFRVFSLLMIVPFPVLENRLDANKMRKRALNEQNNMG